MDPLSILIGIVLVFLAPIGLWLILLRYHQSWRSKQENSRLVKIGIATTLYGLYLGLIQVYSIWLVGYGGILACLLIPALGVNSFFLILYGKNKSINNSAGITNTPAGIIMSVFILVQILSPLTARQISFGCDSLHRALAVPIGDSMEIFKETHGAYPKTIDLVPDYLEKMPPAICLLPVDWLNGPDFSPSEYQISRCDNGVAFVVVRTTFFGSEQTYNLISHEWGSEEDWDDPCDKVENQQ